MAISTEAKAFLASPIAQKVVHDIYSGKVVFSIHATRSILADNYKPRAIEIYDPRKAPFLNHYRCLLFPFHYNMLLRPVDRLRVPRYGKILEFFKLACLMLIFTLCLASASYLVKFQVRFKRTGYIHRSR